MKKRILTLALAFVILTAFTPAAVIADTSVFPYDLEGPYNNTDWTGWTLPIWILAEADVMVVEYEGTLPWYIFSWMWPVEWTGFGKESDRMTEADGKLIFDLSDCNGTILGFYAPEESEIVIKRIYLDVLPTSETINPAPKTVYVDGKAAPNGNGTREKPYRTISEAAGAAKQSDTILVADGVYYETVTLPSGREDRPTLLKAAPGAKPVLTPAIPFKASWSLYKDSIYVADIGDAADVMDAEFPQLFAGGVSMIEARYPNLPGPDMSSIMDQERAVAQKGTTTNTIVAPDILPSGIEGATVVAWLADSEWMYGGWGAEMSSVQSVNGNNIHLSVPFDKETNIYKHYMTEGCPFYIVGALALLDAPGEYYYDGEAGKLYFHAPDGGDPSGLDLSLKSEKRYALNLNKRSFVTVDGFDIYGGGINIVGSGNTVQNCRIRYADHYYADTVAFWGITGRFFVAGCNNTVKRCEIGPTAGNGITITGRDNIITDNIIHDCVYAGHGASVKAMASERLEVSRNTMLSSGGGHVNFGDTDHPYTGCVVKNNHFLDINVLSHDCGAFSTWRSDGGGTEIYNNLVDNSGAKGDQGAINKLRVGLYTDVDSVNYSIHHNVVIGGNGGIATNLPHFTKRKGALDVCNNTIIGAETGYSLFSDGAETSNTENITFKDNLFVDLLNNDISYYGVEDGKSVTYVGGFVDGTVPVPVNGKNRIVSSGNTRGAVDDQYRPTGDTPNVGAVLRGEEMFDYGASWELGDVPAYNPLDSADTWARDHITQAIAKGFIPKDLQNSYSANITRGEFVQLAMSWLRYATGLTNEELLKKHGKPEHTSRNFSDTADPDVLAVAKLDITAGTAASVDGKPGVFGVDTPFNREQAAIMLMKICRIVGTFKEDTSDCRFTDMDQVQWLPDAVNYVGNNGVMAGKTGGRFAPGDQFQRQESIIVFNKMG